MSASDDEARAVLATTIDDWNAVGMGWDAERLSQGYTNDAVFFGGRRGQRQTRAGVRTYFAVLCRRACMRGFGVH